MPGTSVTIARDAPTSALNRLDFADVRLADDRDLQTLRAPAGRAARRPAARDVRVEQCVDARRERAGLDEVIALFRKIDGCFEPGDQIEQRRVDARRSRASACRSS